MRRNRWGRAVLATIPLIALVVVAAGCPPPIFNRGAQGGQAIAVGGVANGHIAGPGHRVRFPLGVSYPRVVTFYVAGRGLDPTVRVYNAAGGQLGFNDDGGQGYDSQLVLSLPPGNYIVEVAGFGSSRGGFSLTVN